MIPAEEYEYCDGPKLMAWLREAEPRLWERVEDRGNASNVGNVLGEGWTRRFYDWEQGSVPSVYTVDRLCVALGRHLLDIPDDVFREARPRRISREISWERGKALEMLDEGYFPLEISKELGLKVDTIRKWRRRQRREAMAADLKAANAAPIPERLEAAAKAAA